MASVLLIKPSNHLALDDSGNVGASEGRTACYSCQGCVGGLVQLDDQF